MSNINKVKGVHSIKTLNAGKKPSGSTKDTDNIELYMLKIEKKRLRKEQSRLKEHLERIEERLKEIDSLLGETENNIAPGQKTENEEKNEQNKTGFNKIFMEY
ncbi:MAG: hypothetical protein K9I68_05355 [Bacteroidales bacterium]|nr:hypothetical protein [Bacteroidales bacterium]MCF8338276.1 hypothetical protein [Bacteroidales bacterium]